MKEWLEGFESNELVKGEENEVGSEYLVTINQEGKPFEMTEIIRDIQEFESVTFDFDNDFMFMNYNAKFSEEDDGTVINTQSIVRGRGIFSRALMIFFKGSLIAQEEKHLNDLKRVIEENETDYFPENVEAIESEAANSSI